MKLTCRGCKWGRALDSETRLRLSQENKEIVNVLERRGLDLDEFVYCTRLGFIESMIAEKDCGEWSP